MEKFVVIAGCVTGARGKVFEQGEKLTAEQLGGKEMAKQLAGQNFVKSLEKESREKQSNVISKLKDAESIESLDEILGDDDRVKVLEAYEKKKKQLAEPKTIEHIITEECLEMNPELVGKVEVGEVIIIEEGTEIKDVVIED